MSIRITHRTRGVAAAAIWFALLVSAVHAEAVQQHQYGLSVNVSPTTAGTPAAPAPVALQLETTGAPDLSSPAFSTKLLMFDLDQNVVISPVSSGACGVAQVQADPTNCARVGDGSMSFAVLGLTENMTVSAFQQSDPQRLLLLVDGSAPLMIHSVMEFVPTDPETGGLEWTLANPPLELQEPAPGAYATWTDLNFTLRSAVGLVGCANSSLRFASHSDFTDGAVGDGVVDVPCVAAPPLPQLPPAPAPAPPKATPHFATRAAKGHGRVLGSLLGIRTLRGFTNGTVTLTCTSACTRTRLASKKLVAAARALLITLHPPLRVTRRTRIKLVTVDATGIRQEQRFRFLRRAGRVVAKAV